MHREHSHRSKHRPPMRPERVLDAKASLRTRAGYRLLTGGRDRRGSPECPSGSRCLVRKKKTKGLSPLGPVCTHRALQRCCCCCSGSVTVRVGTDRMARRGTGSVCIGACALVRRFTPHAVPSQLRAASQERRCVGESLDFRAAMTAGRI